ncbi:MAG: HD domain-containing phosphohydrolase [Candidatus Omnitrophota bacterium]
MEAIVPNREYCFKNENKFFFNSFYVKVVLSFVFSLLFVAILGNFILFRYSLKSHFDEYRDKLRVIARTAAIAIDARQLADIPLSSEGVNAPSFRETAIQLLKTKQANPLIRYIYIMAKTGQPGILQFIVDPDALTSKTVKAKATSFPGDKYDARRLPEMLASFSEPRVDANLSTDAWGKFLSGYAPIFDANNQPIAILGIDIDASDVYLAQRELLFRGIFVLFMGLIFALGLGAIFSMRIIAPIRKLIDGTKNIASGNLDHQVEVVSGDEIGQLAESFNSMSLSLKDARDKLQDYFYRVVKAMVRSLEAKDAYTCGHSERVGEYAYQIAIEMGIPIEKAQLLKRAAQLHDIGKLGIHDDILNKKSSLSPEEGWLIRKHPEVGEEILKPVFLDAEMLSVVRSHHERYDGQGYPDHLNSQQMGIFPQIVSVADAYDAMTSTRSYHVQMAKEEALTKIREGSGTQFNPEVVEAFCKII